MKKYVKLEAPKLKGYACTLEGYKEYVKSYFYYRSTVSDLKSRWAAEVNKSSAAGKVNQPSTAAPSKETLERRKAARKRRKERVRERKRSDEIKKKVGEAKAVAAITKSNLAIAKSLSAEKRILGENADDGWTTVVHKSTEKSLRKREKKTNTFRPGLGYVNKGTTGFKAKNQVTEKKVETTGKSVALSIKPVKTEVVKTQKVYTAEYQAWQGQVISAFATVNADPTFWLSRTNLKLSEKGVSEIQRHENILLECYADYNRRSKETGPRTVKFRTNYPTVESYLDAHFFNTHTWFPKKHRPPAHREVATVVKASSS